MMAIDERADAAGTAARSGSAIRWAAGRRTAPPRRPAATAA
ncbi:MULTISPECIES: hypothetical protein [Streptomyces]|nr:MULTISPECIES: hypothetical protein [Streptomyces]